MCSVEDEIPILSLPVWRPSQVYSVHSSFGRITAVKSSGTPMSNARSAAPSVQEYYGTLECRLGYRLLPGNARHCGY